MVNSLAMDYRRPDRWLDVPDSSSRGRRRGLTLLEVLISLLIFVGAMAAIGQLISNGVRGAVQSRLETQAILRCESKVAEVVAGVIPLQPTGAVPFPDNPSWTWSLQMQPGPHPDLLLFQVTVEHAAGSNVGRTTFRLTRLLRNPQLYADESAIAEEAAEQQQGTSP
jgi:prepilin-type N-terminal cleavage/methylation domain-containing protein